MLLEQLNINYYKKKEVKKDSIFFGKKVCITWSFEQDWLKISRDDLVEKLESVWWEFVSSISKNTDYLLAGDKAWSKKQKAEELWIKILDLNYFLENL